MRHSGDERAFGAMECTRMTCALVPLPKGFDARNPHPAHHMVKSGACRPLKWRQDPRLTRAPSTGPAILTGDTTMRRTRPGDGSVRVVPGPLRAAPPTTAVRTLASAARGLSPFVMGL